MTLFTAFLVGAPLAGARAIGGLVRRSCQLALLLSSAATFAAEPATTIEPHVYQGQWGERRPFHQAVFSIATGSQVEAAKNDSPTGRTVDNPRVQQVLQAVASPVFRLPGGDRLNNFDYFKDEIPIADWKRLADFGGSTPLWGVNVTTATLDQTARFAQALRGLGAEPQLFELGNELYLDLWKKQTPTAHDYIAKAAPHAAFLRQQFPHAKLGVPGASYYGIVQDPQPGSREFTVRPAAALSPWLKELLADQSFYDAVVLHLYLTPNQLGIGKLGERTPAELARWAWVRSDRDLLKTVFGRVHELAPKKEIWVTEWAFNASQYLNRVKEPRWQIHQTILAALYDARFMLNTAYEVPSVALMTGWTLYGQAAVCLITSHGQTTIRYDLYRLLRAVREGSDRLARLTVRDNPRWSGPAKLGYGKFSTDVVDVFGFFSDDRLQSGVVLNVTEQDLTVEIPGLPASGARAVALTQSSLLPGWGDPRNPPVNDWNPPREVRPLATAGGRLTVPPHAIGFFAVRGNSDLH